MTSLHHGVETFEAFTRPMSESTETYEVWLNDAETNQLVYRQGGLTTPERDVDSSITVS